MDQPNPKVDAFISSAKSWQAEYIQLRRIAQSSGLSEELKWGVPCYSLDGKNVVLIHGFKDYCAMLFVKGVLLKDPHKVLIIQTENVQAARQIRFKGVDEILALEPVLKAYIQEAVQVEKAGLKVEYKKELQPFPEEFQQKLDQTPGLKESFDALTPGRQRAYLMFCSQPKQAKTRTERVEKYVQQIMDGKGLND